MAHAGPKNNPLHVTPQEWAAAEAFFAKNPGAFKLERTHSHAGRRVDKRTGQPRPITKHYGFDEKNPHTYLYHSFVAVKNLEDNSLHIYALDNRNPQNQNDPYIREEGFGKVKMAQDKNGEIFNYEIEGVAGPSRIKKLQVLESLGRLVGTSIRRFNEPKELKFKTGKTQKVHEKTITITKYIPGVSIHDLNQRIFTTKQRLQIAISVCKALQEISEKNIIHKHIVTNNILIHIDGGKISANVIDFGISELLPPGVDTIVDKQMPGHIDYLAPETTNNYIYSKKSDLYALWFVFMKLKITTLFPSLQKMIDSIQAERPEDRPNLAVLINAFEEELHMQNALHPTQTAAKKASPIPEALIAEIEKCQTSADLQRTLLNFNGYLMCLDGKLSHASQIVLEIQSDYSNYTFNRQLLDYIGGDLRTEFFRIPKEVFLKKVEIHKKDRVKSIFSYNKDRWMQDFAYRDNSAQQATSEKLVENITALLEIINNSKLSDEEKAEQLYAVLFTFQYDFSQSKNDPKLKVAVNRVCNHYLNWVKQAYPINLTIQDARKMMRNLGDQPSHKMENVEVKAGNPLHSYQRIQQQDASAGEHKEDREPKKPFNPKPE